MFTPPPNTPPRLRPAAVVAWCAFLVCSLKADTVAPAEADVGPLAISVVSGGATAVAFDRQAQPGWSYVVEASSDLVNWRPVWGSTGADNIAGRVTVTDPYPPGVLPMRRFRRLRVSTDPLPAVPMFGARPVVVVKLDDLKTSNSGGFSANWIRVANFAASRGVKMGFGVVANSLEAPKAAYLDWLRATRDAGWVEFWLHGYEHSTYKGADGVTHGEFVGRDYADYQWRLDQSQALLQARLGLVFTSFGPPGGGSDGSFDAAALQALHDDPHIRGVMYPNPIDEAGSALQAKGKVMVMDRVWAVNIEQPLFVPDLEKFISGYTQNASKRRYFVIQGHPPNWSDEERMSAFENIIDYLIAQGCVFVTPTELADLLAAYGP